MRYDFDDGKYAVISENGRQQALRHGEPWRDLTGDNLIYWMMVEIERLRAELAEAQKQAAAYRFIRAGNAYIEPYVTSSGLVPGYVITHCGQHCDTPEEFDAVIFAAMENDNEHNA